MAKVTKIPASAGTKDAFDSSRGWGGEVIQNRVPSGVKVILDPDCDCVLVFLGARDISAQCGKDEGEAIVYSFHDGRQIISMAAGYALKSNTFERNIFYYLHNAGMIAMSKPGLNPMRDIAIIRLGEEFAKVTCPDRVHPDKILTLSLPEIAKANYERLNYPLRPTPAV